MTFTTAIYSILLVFIPVLLANILVGRGLRAGFPILVDCVKKRYTSVEKWCHDFVKGSKSK
jgi:hypothetical protein